MYTKDDLELALTNDDKNLVITILVETPSLHDAFIDRINALALNAQNEDQFTILKALIAFSKCRPPEYHPYQEDPDILAQPIPDLIWYTKEVQIIINQPIDDARKEIEDLYALIKTQGSLTTLQAPPETEISAPASSYTPSEPLSQTPLGSQTQKRPSYPLPPKLTFKKNRLQ